MRLSSAQRALAAISGVAPTDAQILDDAMRWTLRALSYWLDIGETETASVARGVLAIFLSQHPAHTELDPELVATARAQMNRATPPSIASAELVADRARCWLSCAFYRLITDTETTYAH